MNRKIIPFPKQRVAKSCPEGQKGTRNPSNSDAESENNTNAYIDGLRVISEELRRLAGSFDIPVKEVIADFSYVIIGDEIVAILLEEDSDEDGADD